MPVRSGGDYVFSDEKSDGKRALANFAARKARFDKLCGVRGWVIHDLRRVARTALSRAGVSADIAEMCLGHHVLSGVRGVYDKYAYEKEKRFGFERLAAQIESIVRPSPEPVVADMAAERKRRRK
jgi:integrase